MNLAPRHQAGLALGAWGAVQASAAGTAIALGGVLRDLVTHAAPHTALGPAAGYDAVYGIEVALLLATLVTIIPLVRRAGAGPSTTTRPRSLATQQESAPHADLSNLRHS
jgi:BCD family chlorophyll transporter-like MFS transporter